MRAARSGSALIVVLVAVAAALFATRSMITHRPAAVPDQPTSPSEPLPNEIHEWITPPPEYPTPNDMVTERDVAEYVHALTDPSIVWEESYVKRTRESAIISTIFGGGGARASAPQNVVWIVGFRSSGIIPNRVLDNAMHHGPMPGVDDSWSDTGGTQAFVVLDLIGNPIEAGYADPPDENGTPSAYPQWTLSDIQELPPP